MDRRPIRFFDSGVGGLSIFREVRRLLPAESMVYLADNAHFPYGALDEDMLRLLAGRITAFLLGQNVKLVVAACNTATVHALSHLRSVFPGLPFVGVVPVVKPLVKLTRTGVIAMLVTPATADSAYLAGLIADYAPGCRVVTVPCPGLAELVEAGDIAGASITPVLERFLEPVAVSGADVLGLGCTHYPFLRGRIQRLVGSGVRVLDSGYAVARRVRAVLTEMEALAPSENPAGYTLYGTGDPAPLVRAARRYLHLPEATIPVGIADWSAAEIRSV
jgi:glutamate racemase